MEKTGNTNIAIGIQTPDKPLPHSTVEHIDGNEDLKLLFEKASPYITAEDEENLRKQIEPINNSKGCGGVMRVAPIGLFYSQDKLRIDVIDQFGASAAALTHGHPMGYISAAGLVHIVNLAVNKSEMTLKEIVDDMIEKVPALFMDEAVGFCVKFQDLMRKAVKLGIWVVETDHLV